MSDHATATPLCCSIPNTNSGIEKLLREIDGFLATVNCTSSQRIAIRAAIYEISANIVEHSGMAPSDTFNVTCRLRDDVMEFTFSSGGVRFNTATAAEQAGPADIPRPFPKRGYGLKYVHTTASTLTYRYTDMGVNVLTIDFIKETKS